MLIFRSEEHIEKWCKAWRLPFGAVLSLEQAWKLADAWYRDRLSPDWRRRTVYEAHVLFRSLGLTSEFWRLA
jgi:Alkylmercury lyase